MATEEPHIVQGDLPFNVEAVLSRSGKVDALAKRPPEGFVPGAAHVGPHLEAAPETQSSQGTRTAVPQETVAPNELTRVPQEGVAEPHLLRVNEGESHAPPEDATQPRAMWDDHRSSTGETEVIDTSHRETFDDPSRRINTRLRARVVADGGLSDEATLLGIPSPSDAPTSAKDGATASDLEMGGLTAGDDALSQADDTPQTPALASAEPGNGAPSEAASTASGVSDLQRRMEEIKSTNESVARELSALEEQLRQKPLA